MAIQFRTIDGSNNNQTDRDMNQANTDFARVGPANFADGFYEMTEGPNPREISNIVVALDETGEEGHLLDDNGVALSGMMYAWGQFIDHDLDLQKEGTTTDISITVPDDDQFLEPGSTIPLTRRGDRSCNRCRRTSGDCHQHGHRLVRRIADLRIRSRHRKEPADSRRPHENVSGRQSADRQHGPRPRLCSRRRAGAGEPGPDSIAGAVRART